jgi:hypothetical protein
MKKKLKESVWDFQMTKDDSVLGSSRKEIFKILPKINFLFLKPGKNDGFKLKALPVLTRSLD